MNDFIYALKICYDGTLYHGWQVQPNGNSIQEMLQKALKTLKLSPKITGAGRTDAGVHAMGQMAHIACPNPIDTKKLLLSLNGILPHDIRILEIFPAKADFHARYSARRKIYHYSIWNAPVANPFLRRYSLHFSQALDLPLMRRAAQYFTGEKDFFSFANSGNEGSAAKNSTRHLYRLDIVQEGCLIRLELEGNGFLYKMVRNLAGMLLDIGVKKRRGEEIPAILQKRDRRQASKAAPAHGLCLHQVLYDNA